MYEKEAKNTMWIREDLKNVIISFFVFTVLNFVAVDLFYSLKIIPEKYNIFWDPSFYRARSHHGFYIGLNFYFYFCYTTVVYAVTRKLRLRNKFFKDISMFFLKYLLIFFISTHNYINPLYYIFIKPVKIAIGQLYSEKIILDYYAKTGITPWGSYELQESNHSNDEVKVKHDECEALLRKEEFEMCKFHPFRGF